MTATSASARDVALDRSSTDLPTAPADPARLAELAERFNLASPVERLVTALAARG